MKDALRRIAEDERFQTFILMLILLNALMMGVETVPEMSMEYEDLFGLIFVASQLIFVVEIAIRLGAHLPHLRKFFADFWNTFDFLVVAASLLPVVGSFSLVARLLRVLRVARIVSVSDELRTFIDSTRGSIGILVRGGAILLVIIYIFAISGFYLFAESDAANWGSLGRSFLTIFYLALLQNVPGFIEPVMRAAPLTFLYFLALYGTLVAFAINVLAAIVARAVHAAGGAR